MIRSYHQNGASQLMPQPKVEDAAPSAPFDSVAVTAHRPPNKIVARHDDLN
jgi:hypothetical protein